MKTRVLVLGAGFGGLELATMLSERLGDEVDVTLIDKGEGFVFGFAKLDVCSGARASSRCGCPTRSSSSPGCGCCARRSRRSTRGPGASPPTPARTRPTCLVIALGADYDLDATPGLAEGGNEFYSVAGAERLRDAAAARSPRAAP